MPIIIVTVAKSGKISLQVFIIKIVLVFTLDDWIGELESAMIRMKCNRHATLP